MYFSDNGDIMKVPQGEGILYFAIKLSTEMFDVSRYLIYGQTNIPDASMSARFAVIRELTLRK